MTLKIEDLKLIAPEIVEVLRGPHANFHLTVKVGEEVSHLDYGPHTPLKVEPLHRTIMIGDIHLYYARGTSETIDLIRAAVEQCKAGATVYEPVDVGAERSAEMNSRLGYGRSATSQPVRSVFEKPEPTPRFTEGDSAFASRVAGDRRQRAFYKSEHDRKKAKKGGGNG